MDSLDAELECLSKKDNVDWKKFTPSATGVGNCLFISTTVSHLYCCVKLNYLIILNQYFNNLLQLIANLMLD